MTELEKLIEQALSRRLVASGFARRRRSVYTLGIDQEWSGWLYTNQISTPTSRSVRPMVGIHNARLERSVAQLTQIAYRPYHAPSFVVPLSTLVPGREHEPYVFEMQSPEGVEATANAIVGDVRRQGMRFISSLASAAALLRAYEPEHGNLSVDYRRPVLLLLLGEADRAVSSSRESLTLIRDRVQERMYAQFHSAIVRCALGVDALEEPRAASRDVYAERRRRPSRAPDRVFEKPGL